MKIESIRIKHEAEIDPDLLWIGEYSNTPQDGAIDRQENGDAGPREYRYFNPANPEYAQQDYEHMEAYNRGGWSMIGIIAEAVVSYGYNLGCRRLQTFTSSGLWGIETDCGDEHIAGTEQDELADLKEHLGRFGVDTSNWDNIKIERPE